MLLESLNTFLASQPWWVVAIASVALFLVLTRKVDISTSIDLGPKRTFRDQVRAAMKPIVIEGSTSQRIEFRTMQTGMPAPENGSSAGASFAFEGQDAAEFQRLLQSHNKIEAIKFLRNRSGLDLKSAKDIVDVMCSPKN